MARGNGWGLLVMLIVNPLVIVLYQNANVLSPNSIAPLTSQKSEKPTQSQQIAQPLSAPDQSSRETDSFPSDFRVKPSPPQSINLRAPASLGLGTALSLDREANETQKQENKCRFIRPVCQE